MRASKTIPIIGVLLVIIIAYSLLTSESPVTDDEMRGIEFGGLLNLTNDGPTRTSVGYHLVNRDRVLGAPFIIVTSETIEDWNITIQLGAIKNSTQVINLRNQTKLSGLVRYFEAEIVYDLSGHREIVHGWIDQRQRVRESWSLVSIPGTSGTHGSLWIPKSVRFLDDAFCINEFVETTSEAGHEYWNITIGSVEMSPEGSETEEKQIRMFSANTKWRDNTVYWPYAGYISEDLEIYYTRLS